MPSGPGSVVVRRELGRKLKAARLAASKTVEDVAEAGVGSKAKIHRLESGKGMIKTADVRMMAWLYGLDQSTTDSLAALAPATQQEDWYESYGAVVPNYLSLYIGLEATASRLRCWTPEWIHGLVQTEDYARAVIGSADTLTPDVVEQRVGVRMDRQRRVLDTRPDVTVILDAGALTRVVGSPGIMTAQLGHLRQLDRQGAAVVRVLPFEAGAYPMRGSFALLEFDDGEDPAVCYVESSTGAKYLEQPAELQPYERVFQLLQDRSVGIEEWKR